MPSNNVLKRRQQTITMSPPSVSLLLFLFFLSMVPLIVVAAATSSVEGAGGRSELLMPPRKQGGGGGRTIHITDEWLARQNDNNNNNNNNDDGNGGYVVHSHTSLSVLVDCFKPPPLPPITTQSSRSSHIETNTTSISSPSDPPPSPFNFIVKLRNITLEEHATLSFTVCSPIPAAITTTTTSTQVLLSAAHLEIDRIVGAANSNVNFGFMSLERYLSGISSSSSSGSSSMNESDSSVGFNSNDFDHRSDSSSSYSRTEKEKVIGGDDTTDITPMTMNSIQQQVLRCNITNMNLNGSLSLFFYNVHSVQLHIENMTMNVVSNDIFPIAMDGMLYGDGSGDTSFSSSMIEFVNLQIDIVFLNRPLFYWVVNVGVQLNDHSELRMENVVLNSVAHFFVPRGESCFRPAEVVVFQPSAVTGDPPRWSMRGFSKVYLSHWKVYVRSPCEILFLEVSGMGLISGGSILALTNITLEVLPTDGFSISTSLVYGYEGVQMVEGSVLLAKGVRVTTPFGAIHSILDVRHAAWQISNSSIYMEDCYVVGGYLRGLHLQTDLQLLSGTIFLFSQSVDSPLAAPPDTAARDSPVQFTLTSAQLQFSASVFIIDVPSLFLTTFGSTWEMSRGSFSTVSVLTMCQMQFIASSLTLETESVLRVVNTTSMGPSRVRNTNDSSTSSSSSSIVHGAINTPPVTTSHQRAASTLQRQHDDDLLYIILSFSQEGTLRLDPHSKVIIGMFSSTGQPFLGAPSGSEGGGDAIVHYELPIGTNLTEPVVISLCSYFPHMYNSDTHHHHDHDSDKDDDGIGSILSVVAAVNGWLKVPCREVFQPIPPPHQKQQHKKKIDPEYNKRSMTKERASSSSSFEFGSSASDLTTHQKGDTNTTQEGEEVHHHHDDKVGVAADTHVGSDVVVACSVMLNCFAPNTERAVPVLLSEGDSNNDTVITAICHCVCKRKGTTDILAEEASSAIQATSVGLGCLWLAERHGNNRDGSDTGSTNNNPSSSASSPSEKSLPGPDSSSSPGRHENKSRHDSTSVFLLQTTWGILVLCIVIVTILFLSSVILVLVIRRRRRRIQQQNGIRRRSGRYGKGVGPQEDGGSEFDERLISRTTQEEQQQEQYNSVRQGLATSPSSSTAVISQPTQQFLGNGKYRVIRRIGGGSYGAVYLVARTTTTTSSSSVGGSTTSPDGSYDQKFAIKVIPCEPTQTLFAGEYEADDDDDDDEVEEYDDGGGGEAEQQQQQPQVPSSTANTTTSTTTTYQHTKNNHRNNNNNSSTKSTPLAIKYEAKAADRLIKAIHESKMMKSVQGHVGIVQLHDMFIHWQSNTRRSDTTSTTTATATPSSQQQQSSLSLVASSSSSSLPQVGGALTAATDLFSLSEEDARKAAIHPPSSLQQQEQQSRHRPPPPRSASAGGNLSKKPGTSSTSSGGVTLMAPTSTTTSFSPSHQEHCQLSSVRRSLCLVMKYYEHGTLQDALQRHPSLFGSTEMIILFLRQVLDALHHSHLRNVVHRDLKPANVLLEMSSSSSSSPTTSHSGAAHWFFESEEEEGEETRNLRSFINPSNDADDATDDDDELKKKGKEHQCPPPIRFVLSDFGLAKVLEGSAMTTRGSGTMFFLAPEQLQYRVSKKSDVWAVACICLLMARRTKRRDDANRKPTVDSDVQKAPGTHQQSTKNMEQHLIGGAGGSRRQQQLPFSTIADPLVVAVEQDNVCGTDDEETQDSSSSCVDRRPIWTRREDPNFEEKLKANELSHLPTWLQSLLLRMLSKEIEARPDVGECLTNVIKNSKK